MDFPQYLWRIAIAGVPLLIRRGNTCDEPLEKFERKDRPLYEPFLGESIIGVLDHCDIDDANVYSASHRWDWLNE